jgi:hypothetical protein
LRSTVPAGPVLLIADIAKRIPWEAVFTALEEALKAKKEKEVWRALALSWERIGGAKDFFYKALQDEGFPPEKLQKAKDELQPKLAQLQNVAADIRLKLDKGDLDGAKQQIKNLINLLEQLKQWFKAL